MAEVPEGLHYTAHDVWMREGNADTVRVGLTAPRVEQLADIVYVSLPQVGEDLVVEDTCAQVESTALDGLWDVLSPLSGVVTSANPLLDAAPELVQSDCYGDGWLFEMESSDPGELDQLFDSDGYSEQLTEV